MLRRTAQTRSLPLSGRRRAAVVLATIGSLAALGLLGAPAASAAGSVVVSQTEGLDPSGHEITVTGTGFDEEQGIYVSVCVDNGPGQLPTPCLGGVDTTGASGSSAWISSNPPPYAEGLTIPYGPGGSYEVTIFAVGGDPKTGIDCTVVSCSLVTRSDHTATDDRSQDTRTPLTFLPAGGPASTSPPPSGTDEPTDEPAANTGAPTEATTTASASDATAVADATDQDDSAVPPLVWVGGGALMAAAATAFVASSRRRTEKGSQQ